MGGGDEVAHFIHRLEFNRSIITQGHCRPSRSYSSRYPRLQRRNKHQSQLSHTYPEAQSHIGTIAACVCRQLTVKANSKSLTFRDR